MTHHRHCDSEAGRGTLPALVPGLILVSLGVLFLLDNLHIIRFGELLRYWPVILVALGMAKLVDARDPGGRVAGGILLGAGGLLLLRTLGLIDWHMRDLWPLILIAVGLIMLAHRLMPERTPVAGVSADPTLSECAVFGGIEREIATPEFDGGSVSTVFGGIKLDLRRAAMKGETAVIDASCLFGGVELKVPVSWKVESQVTPIFGGVEIKTAHPDPAVYPDPCRLIIRGSVTFGGVEVKN